MVKLARWLTGILLVVIVAGMPLSLPDQNGTIPAVESSLFCTPAQAAPSWLPWIGEQATPLSMDEMYSDASALGLEFSPKLKSLAGKLVTVTGFMAPPLKPTLRFFVLTKVPMSICPFCSTDADWPNDIIVVKLAEPVTALPFDRPISVTGRLELGYQLDEETGFVSLVRVAANRLEEAE